MSHTVGRLPRGVVLGFLLLFGKLGLAGMRPDVSQSVTRTTTVSCSVSPGATHLCVHPIRFAGLYAADGEFRSATKHPTWHDLHAVSTDPRPGLREREVPPFVKLHPLERDVENFVPPFRATEVVRGQSRFAAMRDDLLTFVYGRERALVMPHDIIVDSRGRVLVSDPGARAVHVLDRKNSFRIMAGPGRRMIHPGAIAVDADDNIYVSDRDLGLIVVYDAQGSFLRYIGKIDDETLFVYPTGIAVDRENRRLYVLDSPRGVLFMMDLYGHLLARFAHGDPLFLAYPTRIKVVADALFILDGAGSRVQVTDLLGNPLRTFNTYMPPNELRAKEMGITVDSDGHVFVSNYAANTVRVFDREGKMVNSFGHGGNGFGEFMLPDGMWIDAAGRLYIVDKMNRRVQVFDLAENDDLLRVAGN